MGIGNVTLSPFPIPHSLLHTPNFVQKGLALAQSLVKSPDSQVGVGESKVIGVIPAYSDFASNTVK
jgi:hypothetical protein